jgi:hypothetical protein
MGGLGCGMIRPEDVDAMVTRAAGPDGRRVMPLLLSMMVPEAAVLGLRI